MITWTVPPSTPHAAPLTYEARLGAEEDDHGADLGGLGQAADRPGGARRFSASSRDAAPEISFDWSSRPPGAIHISDAVGPGQTALTSTPLAA